MKKKAEGEKGVALSFLRLILIRLNPAPEPVRFKIGIY